MAKNYESYYYFFMKVGNANCFLKYADLLGGLWVGYDGVPIPKMNKSGLCEKNKEQADLRYLANVSQTKIRDKIRVVSYSKDYLQIFKITGALKYLDQNNKLDWKDSDLYKTFPQEWHTSVKDGLDGIGSKKFLKQVFGINGWKVLPAELVASIPRASLIAPIDSLSVWQSFNRKTFQPMFTLKGTDSHTELNWLKKLDDLDSLPITATDSLNEGDFGKMIRLYLDAKLNKSRSAYSKISDDELTKSIIAMLNPAQVETLAFHLSNDLGFVADIGVGKGLDVADVKATVRNLNTTDQNRKVQFAISALESVGVVFSEKLRSGIEATSTIRFQCKARKTRANEDLGTLLVVEPGKSDQKRRDSLFLETLLIADPKKFPMVHSWLEILKFDLKM